VVIHGADKHDTVSGPFAMLVLRVKVRNIDTILNDGDAGSWRG
jgi:hypothetical protein